MLGNGLWKMAEVKVPGPTRPDGFRESVEERTEAEPAMDYPDGSEGDISIDTADDYGYNEFGDRPIGVYLTNPIPSDSPLYEWTTGTVTLSDINIQQIASGDRRRRRFIVRNLHETDNAFLMRNNMDADFAAFTLMPGQEVEFTHNAPIWARGESANVGLTYFAEFILEEAEHER